MIKKTAFIHNPPAIHDCGHSSAAFFYLSMVETENVSIHVPTRWIPLIETRFREEGYKSRSNYGVSNIGFDLLCRRKHQLITPRDFTSDDTYQALTNEVADHFGDANKMGTWIDARTAEQAEQLACEAIALLASRRELATEVSLCAAIQEISKRTPRRSQRI